MGFDQTAWVRERARQDRVSNLRAALREVDERNAARDRAKAAVLEQQRADDDVDGM